MHSIAAEAASFAGSLTRDGTRTSEGASGHSAAGTGGHGVDPASSTTRCTPMEPSSLTSTLTTSCSEYVNSTWPH